MTPTPYQTAPRPHVVAQHSEHALSSRVQRKGSLGTLHTGCNAEKIRWVHPVVSLQGCVAGKQKGTGFGTSSHQTMKHGRVPRFLIQQDGTTTEVAGAKRANLNRFAIAEGRHHARTARFEADGCVLAQKSQKYFLNRRSVIRLSLDGHEGFSLVGTRGDGDE